MLSTAHYKVRLMRDKFRRITEEYTRQQRLTKERCRKTYGPSPFYFYPKTNQEGTNEWRQSLITNLFNDKQCFSRVFYYRELSSDGAALIETFETHDGYRFKIRNRKYDLYLVEPIK